MSSPSSLVDELRGGVGCPVLTERAELERYSYDFGNTRKRLPLAVVRARSEQDVVHTLKVSRALGVPVSVRGAGHSVSGQTLCEGIVLSSDSTAGEAQVLEDGTVEASCRSRWRRVERAMTPKGRTFPVLTSLMQTTLGGTLSTGGYGVRSIGAGAQVDHVERARLILPDGRAVWCSREENPELFRFSLAGFGQVGVLERVVLRTEPDRPFVRLHMNRHRSLQAMLEAIAWTETWTESAPELFFAEYRAGKLWSIFGTYHESAEAAESTPVPEPLARMTRDRVNMVVKPSVLHRGEDVGEVYDPALFRVMGDYCFDLEGMRRFVAFLEAEPARFWTPQLELTRMLAIANPPTGMRWPFDLRTAAPTTPRLYGFGFYYMGRVADAAGLEAAQAAHRACLEKCLELGGRPYLYGRTGLTRETLQSVYGADYARVRALREDLDPQGLLNPEGL
jgi:FAD/FMN-containing dehydrogenase